MEKEELQRRVSEMMSRPLLVACRMKNGKEKILLLEQCIETGSRFVHIVLDDLDRILTKEIGDLDEV